MVALVFKKRGRLRRGAVLPVQVLLVSDMYSQQRTVSEASSSQDFEVVIGLSDLSSPDVEKHRYSVEQVYAHEAILKGLRVMILPLWA